MNHDDDDDDENENENADEILMLELIRKLI